MLTRKINNHQDKTQRRVGFGYSKIQTVKSLKDLNSQYKNDSQTVLEDKSRKVEEKAETSMTLASSKSMSKISPSTSFFRVEREMTSSTTTLNYNLSSPNLDKNREYREESVSRRQISIPDCQNETAKKKPKFTRSRNAQKKEVKLNFSIGKDKNFHGIFAENNGIVLMENIQLKKQNLQCQKRIQLLQGQIQQLSFSKNVQKIKQLQLKNAQLQRNLLEKDEQIKQLSNKICNIEEQSKQNQRKYLELVQQQEIFKGSISSFDLDDSGIKVDMLSTAQYVQSLTDLEEELQKRKSEIFGLNQLIEQLRIKNHFQQIRNEQNLRRQKQQFDHKYKSLLQHYRNLKEKKNQVCKCQCKLMLKRKTKTEFIDFQKDQKQDLFNLSLSTDRSHTGFY